MSHQSTQIVFSYLLIFMLFSCTSPQIANPKKAVIQTHFIKKNFSLKNYGMKMRHAVQKEREKLRPFDTHDSNWQLVFEDNFDSINTKKWRLGQAWGEFHPEVRHQYYSKEMIFTIDGYLHLKGEYAPKKFKYKDSIIEIPLAIGLINSDISFQQKYGYFEIRSKNPKGAATWPAFWLTGANKWPPEIDIFEMYGRKGKNSIHNQYATIHYGQTGTKSKGFLSRKINLNHTTDTLFHTYACEWDPQYIKFYTDGVPVAFIRLNKRLQQWMDDEMVIVINNSFDESYLKYFQSLDQIGNDFVIDYIKVYKKI
jgi:beta-glucanase (GH16 family)